MSYQFIDPTEEQKETMQILRDEYEKLAARLDELTPSRGISLAKTKLEESSFWVNKGITKND